MAAKRDQPLLDREAVERKAYDLYLSRGFAHGHHVEDWLRAEALLLAKVAEGAVEETAGAGGRKLARGPSGTGVKP
jgi:hypothetical protein